MPPGPGARKAIFVSTVSVLAGSGVALAGSLVVRVLMARALSPGDLGLVLLGIAVVTPVGAIAGLGTNAAVAQRLAECRSRGLDEHARSVARKALLLAGATGAAAALVLALAAGSLALILGQPGVDRVLLPLAPVALGLAAGSAALGVSRGFDDSLGRALVRDAGGGMLRVVGVGAAALAVDPTSPGIAAGFAGGSLLAEALFVGYVVAKGWIRRTGKAPREPLLSSLRPYAATEALAQATLWLDVVVLGALAPAAVVGLYGVARGLTRVLDLVRQASSHGYLPAASAAVVRGEEGRLRGLHVETRRLSFALVWPVLSVCILTPAPLIGLLFGAEYAPAATTLRLLAIASFLPSFFDFLDLLLLAERRPGDVLGAGLVGSGALALLLFALAGPFGGDGAALALLGAGLVRGLLCHRLAFRNRAFRPYLPGVTGPALLAGASLAAGALLLALLRPSPPISLLVAAGVGAAASAASFRAFLRHRETEPAAPAAAPGA